jgi:hypothetical protein
VPADGIKAANWRKRRLRYVAVFGQLSLKAICLPISMYLGYRDRSTMTRREFNSRLRLASTYAGLMSPTGRGSSRGLRSVRFDSELHSRVCVVCLFCTREPSCSHLTPSGLFDSAPGTRHAFAVGGMAPKFFRWVHCGTSSNAAHEGQVPCSFAVPPFIRKRHAAAQQRGNWRQSGVEMTGILARLGGDLLIDAEALGA